METITLWDEGINEELEKVSEQQLDLFLSLLNYIDDKKISNRLSYQLCDNPALWQWLSSKEALGLRDMKRELSIMINKARKISSEEYTKLVCNIGKLGEAKILVLDFENENIYYVSTMDEYYKGLRKYLEMEKKDDFCKDMSECFPNIYFDDGINATVNSLNRNFDDLKEEIVDHLTKINDYHSKFILLLSQNKSNQVISQQFYADTGIECSPQSSRDGIQVLKISCYNEINKRMESVKCELHTKFKKFNIDREKQDRIYFFPGRPGIKEGKIIVKHIGTHL